MSVDHDYAYVASASKTNSTNIVQGQAQPGRIAPTAGVGPHIVGGAQRMQNTVLTNDGRQVMYASRSITQSGVIQPMTQNRGGIVHGGLPPQRFQRVQQVSRPVAGGQQVQRILVQQPGGAVTQLQRTGYAIVTTAPHSQNNVQYVRAMAPTTVQGSVLQNMRQPPQQQVLYQNRNPQGMVINTSSTSNQPMYVTTSSQGAPVQQHHVYMQAQTRPVQYITNQPVTGMNLSVPIREPTPEPVPIKQEIPEPEPAPSNFEPYPTEDEVGDIDIQIRNVVCNYTLPLHIDLRRLALNSNNVTYDRGRGVMMKQKRNPNCYIKIYSSGKVYIVGCRSEVDCKLAARSVARHIQRVMGKTTDRIAMRNYKVNNVLATCRMPFGIKIEELAQKYPVQSQYEPELSVGLVWRSTTPKATLRIHTTGSITVTGANSEKDVMDVIEQIYPIAFEFRCADRAKGKGVKRKTTKKRAAPSGPRPKREKIDDDYEGGSFGTSGVMGNKVYFSDEDDIYDDEDLDLDD